MKDLHEAGLRGKLPCFIEGFLKNRQFSVRSGACLSGLFDQEMGVPQGSVLSVTLFALKINSIVKAISPGFECSLYVDDYLIVYRSKYIHIIERRSRTAAYLGFQNVAIQPTCSALLSPLLSRPPVPSFPVTSPPLRSRPT